jgi:hypothetical protein
MNNITNLLERYSKKENFRFFPEQTLFAPNWDALKKKACPLCGCKLKIPRKGKMAFCNSKKHGKSFIISLDKLK